MGAWVVGAWVVGASVVGSDSSTILIVSVCPDSYITLARLLAYPECVFM